MSTEVDIDNVEAFNDAKMRLRSDSGEATRRAWLVISHVDNNPNKVHLLAEGEGFNECKENLADDQVMYILFRLSSTFDMSTTVKFVYIHW